MSKANWSPEMTTIFCNLTAKEKEKGNRPTKILNPVGYKNVEVGFFQQTGKLYSRLQFKNKWGSLRTLYRDWLILKNTSTGLGWNDETNTVIADDEWWKKAGEENKDILQFRKCGPENLNQMSIMYEKINVIGGTSMMPGGEHEVLDLEEDETEEVEVQTTQAKKANKGPWKIDGSSSKKNPIQRDFKRMVDHLISEDVAMNSHKNSVATEIEKIMEEVLSCGADETSDEYFIATKLFAKFENRCFFNNMKTSEGKMNCLRRMYEEQNRH
ncbi:L10-interacting MYB domain-containing protein [Triticum aestivum]|uniref:L10-interacting MYB domain-containing protein n=1 Tax=Triticum aestivum TaxID=4565 RepID=UPI001D00CB7D|nr:L10-interacting MYB domain-containing protein-like [Triticum aestivum]